MKLLKKAVSALLASFMCVPSGILNFAEAAEPEGMAVTATLSETEKQEHRLLFFIFWILSAICCRTSYLFFSGIPYS